jgi:transcription elongation factor GreB
MSSRYSNYITKEGAQSLQDELTRLWNVERPRVTQGVADAAAEGDRSENAEYIYGKKRLREIHRRARFLKKRLESLTVVEETPPNTGKVYFASWVKVEDAEGNEAVYRIVGPDETDSDRGFISIVSPMGRALMGKCLDDEVVVKRPIGDTTLIILEIAFEPIEEG